jgi:serine/threonine protein kinase
MTVDMTPERWKRTEELYHAARAQPPDARAAFLQSACRDDSELRRDLESLLSEPDSDDGFLSKPALVMPPDLAGDVVPMIGRSLGGYRLESLLGAGGMGEVYRALDTKLGREVAIKILPRAFISHPERLARFEREARILASLNHLNICAIYGVEEAEGIRFLILELVEGDTLADKLRQLAVGPSTGPGLPLAYTVVMARQIADALEVAHEKGIVHRDL